MQMRKAQCAMLQADADSPTVAAFACLLCCCSTLRLRSMTILYGLTIDGVYFNTWRHELPKQVPCVIKRAPRSKI